MRTESQRRGLRPGLRAWAWLWGDWQDARLERETAVGWVVSLDGHGRVMRREVALHDLRTPEERESRAPW